MSFCYPNSRRTHLRRLVEEHPNLTPRQYAEALQQTQDSIRAALSRMGIKRTHPERPKRVARSVVSRPEHRKAVPASGVLLAAVSGSGRVRASAGYLKLL